MERITNADVERIAATVSKGMPGTYTVNPQRRNGWTGLDLWNGPDCIETLHVGTGREVYTYLQGMRRLQLIESATPYHPGERAQLALGYLAEAVMHDGPANEAQVLAAVEILSGRADV